MPGESSCAHLSGSESRPWHGPRPTPRTPSRGRPVLVTGLRHSLEEGNNPVRPTRTATCWWRRPSINLRWLKKKTGTVLKAGQRDAPNHRLIIIRAAVKAPAWSDVLVTANQRTRRSYHLLVSRYRLGGRRRSGQGRKLLSFDCCVVVRVGHHAGQKIWRLSNRWIPNARRTGDDDGTDARGGFTSHTSTHWRRRSGTTDGRMRQADRASDGASPGRVSGPVPLLTYVGTLGRACRGGDASCNTQQDRSAAGTDTRVGLDLASWMSIRATLSADQDGRRHGSNEVCGAARNHTL
jgi:hypothetical protein